MLKKKWIPVVAAIIRNKKGEILINKRPREKILGGLWEFPGGKVEPNESLQEALIREIKQELGITIHVKEFIMFIKWDESHKGGPCININFFECEIVDGIPKPQEKNQIKWVRPEKIRNYTKRFVPVDTRLFPFITGD